MIAKLSTKKGTPVWKLCINEAEMTKALDPARMCAPDANMAGAGGKQVLSITC